MDQTPNLHPVIEAHFEWVEAGQESHEKCLGEHDKHFEVYVKRMERQATLIEKIGEILTSLKEAQVQHLGYTHATHGIVATTALDGMVMIEQLINLRRTI